MPDLTDAATELKRADLHCHSRFSVFKYFRRANTRDCYNAPEDVYRIAKERGMSFVTLTDHDSIDGALYLLNKYPDMKDFFIGEEVETHQSAFRAPVCDDLSAIGGPVIQDSVTPALHEALGIDKEPALPEATATALRTTPSLLGFGLLEAVPDAEILALADPFDRNGDGISGRPNRTADGRLGRFGRKAQIATLSEFNAGAFVNEMGITSPAEPNEQLVRGEAFPPGVDPTPDPELTQEALDATTAFVRLLAPPRPLPRGVVEQRGALVFLRIGCASCHFPVLVTGPNRVAALSLKIVRPYTDLLLHDMGPDLADICLGRAEPAEFRTEPLMGLRFKTAFLHDGRAGSIEQAILAHGGEAARARGRFLRLSAGERYALLQFLGGL